MFVNGRSARLLRRQVRRQLGSVALGTIEAQGEGIARLGHSVAADLSLLRTEMLAEVGTMQARVEGVHRRVEVLEQLATWPFWRRWWWVLTGR